MDWRTLPSDSKLHDLIFERVAEANPELSLDELYETNSRFVQEFDICIGSQSVTVQYGVIDSEVVSLFAHGACALLAYELGKSTGLPIAVWTTVSEKKGWSGHAALLIGPETVLDIRGVNRFDEVVSYYASHGLVLSEPQVVAVDEFIDLVASDKYRADPLEYADELERLLISGYAQQLRDSYL